MCIQTEFLTQEDWLLLEPSTAGFGKVLNQIENASLLVCGQECVVQVNCTAAIYFPCNQTCTLLHVEDMLDDWEETDDDVSYIYWTVTLG